jgi:hypothetical protein
MLKIFKITSFDSSEVRDAKVDAYMTTLRLGKTFGDDGDDFCISNLIEDSYRDLIEFKLNDNVSIILTIKNNIDIILDMMEKSGIQFKVDDITCDYYTNKIGSVVGGNLVKEFAKFLSVDDVLDKISNSGIDSISDLEKQILIHG